MLKSKTSLIAVDRQRNVTNEIITTERQNSLKDFMEIFIDSYDEEIDGRFNKNSDKKIAFAVLELFRRRENIEKYNKKALYVLIREMTNEKTQDISKVVNIIKKEFKQRLTEYEGILGKTTR